MRTTPTLRHPLFLLLLLVPLAMPACGNGDGDDGPAEEGDAPLHQPDRRTGAILSLDEREIVATLQGDKLHVGLVVRKTGEAVVRGNFSVTVEALDGSRKQTRGSDFKAEAGVETLTTTLDGFARVADPDVQAAYVIRYLVDAEGERLGGARSLFASVPKGQVVLLGPKRLHAGRTARLKVFAADAVTGEPRAGEKVILRAEVGDETVEEEATTDDEGAATVEMQVEETGSGTISATIVRGGGASDTTAQDVEVVRTSRVLVTTDKPRYQPGQNMHLRVLALALPEKAPRGEVEALIEVFDGKGNKVFKHKGKTSEFGIAAATFKLAREVNEGTYKVQATVGDTATEKAVTVEKYSLPKFKVDLEVERPFYLVGETLKGTVTAGYFFGKPVAGGTVVVRLLTFDVEWSELRNITGTTSDDGVYAFELKLPDQLVGQDLAQGRAIVRLEVEVEDTAGQKVGKETGVPVAQDRFNVLLVPESGTLVAEVANQVYVFAEDAAGAPVEVDIELELPAGSETLETDATGFASFEIEGADGPMEISWSAKDAQGNEASGKATLAMGAAGASSVLVRTDKALYEVGETMEVRVFAPDRADRVYVDLVLHGQLVREQAADLKEGQAVVSVDLDAELAGDLAVSAYYLGAAGAIVRDEKLVWVEHANALKIDVSPDLETYAPGDTAKVEFEVTGEDGAGVVAALGLQVVDEAVYALSEAKPGLLRTYFELDESIREPHYQIEGASFDLGGVLSGGGDAPGEEERQTVAKGAFAALGEAGATQVTSSFARLLAGTVTVLKPFYEEDGSAVEVDLAGRIDSGELEMEGAQAFLEGEHPYFDMFGNAYRFKSSDRWTFSMTSHGPDEVEGTADDWTGTVAIMSRQWAAEERMDEFDMATGAGGPPPAPAPGGEVEKSEGGDEGPRVRQDFPETLYFNPELITDPDGTASIEIPMADSITEWRMTGLANSLDGRLGSTTQGLVVFMDFFADIDLPRTLTRGDEVRFPVAVYNYLPDAQTVQLDIEVGDWAELLTSATERVELGPGEVKGVRVGIRAKKVGWHPVKVTASSSAAEDALIRLVEVTPDGQPVRGSRSGRLDGTVAETVTFPEGAIEGTESLTVKLYPGVVAQAVEGLDSLLQMPSGCFEQTTATLWPNALVLDYMSTAGQITPEIELKAREFVSLGYQRLLTFECTGGGFTWFGDPAPANLILSAMGVLEFSDIAKVQDIDETLIPRTMQFLASKQSSDGSWHETQGSEFATVQYTDLMTTCFVTWALAEAGLDDASVKKGFDYAAQRLDDETPTYALALCANAFAWYNPQSSATAKALDDLASRAKHMEGDLVSWDAGVGGDGLYYGERGGGTSIETTALATLALLQGRSAPDLVGGALAFMASNKDSFGNWGTTHATILSLRAFVRSLTAVASEAAGTVTVSLGGTEHASIEVNEDNLDVFQQVDLYEHVVPAAENPVEIRFEGTGSLMYQIVWSHYVPGPPPSSPDEAISIEVSYDKTTLEVNDTVGVEATITNNTERPLPMVLVDLGLPPGFTVLTADLDKAVAERLIERYDLTARQVMVYLEKLESEPLVLTYGLQARYPLKVKAPDSSASLYYDPETKGSDEGEAFEVQE